MINMYPGQRWMWCNAYLLEIIEIVTDNKIKCKVVQGLPNGGGYELGFI
jgi:hypothetical protein